MSGITTRILAVAAVVVVLGSACKSSVDLEDGSSVQRVGPDNTPLKVSLSDGRLTVSTANGATLYQTGSDEYVHGYASGPFCQANERDLLIWLARRDANLYGVVPHHSGWMEYGDNPWIHMHLGMYAFEGETFKARWISSGFDDPIEAAVLEKTRDGTQPTGVWLRQRGAQGPYLARYRFRGWRLMLEKRAPLDRARGFPAALLKRDTKTGMVDLAFVGDIMLGREVGRRLTRFGYERAFSEIRGILADADIVVGNLESCFSQQEPPVADALTFFAPRRHVGALSYLGFDVMNVANNHCDRETSPWSQRLLNTEGIRAIGTAEHGFDENPLVLRRNGLRIGFLGAMVLPTSSVEVEKLIHSRLSVSIAMAKASTDFLIATVHWGEEYTREPSPAQRRLAQWLVDQGIDVVVGHHSHVVQPVEVYKSGLIAYSLGNFLFDQEGYIETARGVTEQGLMLRVRVHHKLGWSKQEIATCIIDRYQVKLCALP